MLLCISLARSFPEAMNVEVQRAQLIVIAGGGVVDYPGLRAIVFDDRRVPGPFCVTLALALALAVALGAAAPLVVGGEDSGGQAGLSITMTGETDELEFSLTVSSVQGGSVKLPGEGVFTYGVGTVVELEAIADDDFRFLEWTGDTDSIDDVDAARTTILVDADYSISATFEEDPFLPSPLVRHDLVLTSIVGGNVTVPGEGLFEYDRGTVVDLVAEPAEGFRFLEWTGDVSTIVDATVAVTSIVMHGDYEIQARFESLIEHLPSPFPWWWFLVGTVAAGLLVYLLWWRRRRRRAYSGSQE